MSIILGNKTITDIYLGDKSIVNGWVGDKLVFGQTEGIWWTRHKWLVVSVSIGTVPLAYNIESDSISYSINIKSWGNSNFARVYYNDKFPYAVLYYFGGGLNKNIRLWTNRDVNIQTPIQFAYGLSTITIENNVLTAFGQTSPFPYRITQWEIRNSNESSYTSNYSVSEVKFDTTSLTPCQLLRTLPASKAWDGKTHSAGECGMWDTVGDKFYGNAASSGSFTVSDED